MDATLTERLYDVVKDEGMRVHLKVWARDVEAGAVDQARNIARLPIALHHVALMPDAHQGYGMPIGGVFMADRAVVPYAVGVDIGCGVTLVELDAGPEELTTLDVAGFIRSIARGVPAGNGPIGEHSPPEHAYVDDGELNYPDYLWAILESAEKQVGTLGGGNHFLELQQSEAGALVVMIHSGSRSVGKKICDRHHRVAADLAKRWHIDLPDPNLAWLPWETDEGQSYWNDMHVALGWAEQNRQAMAEQVVRAARGVIGVDARQTIDVHHNYAAWENHFGQNGVVHRKGAVRARVGEVVLIPGSMGTASFVATGVGSKDSFQSCQHGAGRVMSRGAGRKAFAGLDASVLDRLGIGDVVLVTPDRDSVADEAPRVYKDVDAVMAASTDLVTATTRLRPVGVLKG